MVFDRLQEHGLKLKPSKCEVFKPEIKYLAHHVSQKGVLPSKKNLESIAQCLPLDTYTKVKSFVGLVGHYRCFIKGFAKIAVPLYDLTSGDNKDKKEVRTPLTCAQRLLKPLIASRQPVSRLPSWPSQILTNPSFWKWTPPGKA